MGERVPQVQIDWEVVGAGDEVVCLIHPLGTERGFWQQLLPRLEGRRGVLVDLPGHGRAPVPSHGYAITDLADLVAAALAEVAQPPASVVGASMGGMVALALAARDPERVGRLVLADATAWYSRPLREMWARRAATARSEGTAGLLDDLLDVWFTPAAREAGGAGVDYFRRALFSTPPEGYALACEALASADLRREAARIRVPTLVLAGDEDVLAEDSRHLAETIPSAELHWVPEARHGAPLERPGEVADAVLAFLERTG